MDEKTGYLQQCTFCEYQWVELEGRYGPGEYCPVCGSDSKRALTLQFTVNVPDNL